ncbi:MAG TPA: ABC transporter ATP-binding protein [Candidatus Andersenbacteria bacterium]|nr:ABC transporter ATP-binding protein [Candidatus Andersenbacteria bacterium]
MALIQLENITKDYISEGTVTSVLHGISFSIQEGEFVSIMGPSGSGKSTLLHILGLLDRQTTGSYFFDQHDISTLSDEQRAQIRNQSIGFVFQAFHLLKRTTVLENVILPLYYSSVPKKEYIQKATAALEHVELSHRLNHMPSQLSGGERQRVAIARALVNDPKVIFADEPTGNLDSKTGATVMNTIEKLHLQGKTIIVITHETAAADYANRIITIADGLVASDKEVRSPHTHYSK